MAQELGAITSDSRLDRILGAHDRPCAIQLWVLQLKWSTKTETRILYGRITPSSYHNNQWSAPREDAFKLIDEDLYAQVVRLNLYCVSTLAKGLVESLVAGSDLGRANTVLGITQSAPIAARFGSTCLGVSLGFRPVMHLPSRDYYRWSTSRLSPTASASADSAAITNLGKSELFVVGTRIEPALAAFATDELSGETGLDFSGVDAWRLGDVELLVLPGMDEDERQLVNVKGDRTALAIELLAPLGGPTTELQIRAKFLNDSSVFHIDTASLAPGSAFPVTVTLSIPPSGQDMFDAYTLDIDARDSGSAMWRPRVQWGAHLIREINQEMHFDSGVVQVKSDWLSKALRPAHQSRLEDAQQITRQTRASSSVIGGRLSDPWVSANRQASRVLSQLVPPKSAGRFFLRYSEGDGAGRLELAEWLKKLLATHPDKHIAWFDPYMEDVGIGLLNQYGYDAGNYLIFTTVPAEKRPKDWIGRIYSWIRAQQGRPEKPEKENNRVDKLKKACQAWAHKAGSVRLRVIGLPSEGFHDRMILIRTAHMEPVAGYHLSNSIQRSNENYPLLITDIPLDVLRRVMAYSDDMIKNALGGNTSTDVVQPANAILFDSDAHPYDKAPIYTRDDIYKMRRAGEVLAWWLGNPGLAALSGDQLKQELNKQGLLADGDLRGPLFDDPPPALWSQGFTLQDFNSAWDAMGTLLASTLSGDRLREAPSNKIPALSQALYDFLGPHREDAIQPPPERYGLANMTELLKGKLSELMCQMADPERMFHHDVTEVSWGDYYAIKVLWFTDAPTLVRWVEEVSSEMYSSDRRCQLGLKCAVRLVGFEIARGCSKPQFDALLASRNDFLRWMGFVAFEALLQDDPRAVSAVNGITRLGSPEKIQLLGWLIARANRRQKPIRNALISEFMSALPVTLTDQDLAAALNSMRGPLKRLYDTPPWILQDVVAPLIQSGRVSVDQAAILWMKELVEVWEDEKEEKSLLFRADSEGAFTDEVASLLALAGTTAQKQLIIRLTKQLRTCGRTVRLPFSAQTNYSRYHRALVVSRWLTSLLNQALKRLPRPSLVEAEFHQILSDADELVSRRPDHDWRRSGMDDLIRYHEDAA